MLFFFQILSKSVSILFSFYFFWQLILALSCNVGDLFCSICYGVNLLGM